MHLEAEPVPLTADADGTLRIGGTRVTLDSVIGSFHDGATAEAIADRFPSVRLSDIYEVIGWYLRHRDETDDYLLNRQKEANQLRMEAEQRFSGSGLRERLLVRQQQNGR